MTLRIARVAFADEAVQKAFDELASGPFEEKQLHEWISRAVSNLKQNPLCGVRVPSKLWPKQYAKYGVNNLFKLDLPKGWRLVYFLRGNDVEIISVILEWFSHENYEKRFGYKKK